eukprot:scaffold63446_cov21-Tisochrysis_lutea.AAC.1
MDRRPCTYGVLANLAHPSKEERHLRPVQQPHCCMPGGVPGSHLSLRALHEAGSRSCTAGGQKAATEGEFSELHVR